MLLLLLVFLFYPWSLVSPWIWQSQNWNIVKGSKLWSFLKTEISKNFFFFLKNRTQILEIGKIPKNPDFGWWTPFLRNKCFGKFSLL
jgi:hypothetical protein